MWGAAKKLTLKTKDEKPSFVDLIGEKNVDSEDEKISEDRGDVEKVDGAKEDKLESEEEVPVKSMLDLIAKFRKDKQKKKGTSSPGGSPRSQTTPKSNALEENEKIQALVVKEEDFILLRKSIEQTGLFTSQNKNDPKESRTYTVRKSKSQDQVKIKRSNQFLVAKPAPQGASLKSPEKTPIGPRYTEEGEIVPHSVLGSVRDFIDEALKRNDIRLDSPAVQRAPATQSTLEVKQYPKPWAESRDYIPTSMNQENALRNWERKMAERKKVQGRISHLLDKPLDRLIMNQDLKFRRNQEKKHLVDRAIPSYDYGKGYRVNSEFWSQCEPIGDDITGIKMTLTKTEKGSPVIFEHVGKPITIQHELGETWQGDRPTHDPRRTWSSSKYLKKRVNQLGPVMASLEPHKPDLTNLEVIGNDRDGYIHFHDGDCSESPIEKAGLYNEKDPLSSYPDVVEDPILGPGLLFNKKPAYWTGPKTGNEKKVFSEARICFDCVTKQKSFSKIEIQNIGTTAIFYEWRKIPQTRSFKVLKQDSVQRFYFNTGEGFILPGDTTMIPFVFKSPNPGIFSETWEFVTKPTLMSGAMLQVTLRGVADKDEQTTSEEREKFDKDLREKEALFDVQQIIYDIINGIQSPERPPTPIDAYITEKEIFERKNPGRYYDYDTITELKNFYLQLFGEEDREGREWDLSLDELQSCVTAVPDELAQEEMLVQLNIIIGRLSIPPMTPLKRRMYALAYKSWKDTVDRIVGCAMLTRSVMGLPEMIMVEASPAVDSEIPIAVPSSTPLGKAEAKDDKKGKGKKGKDAKEDKSKKGKKDNKENRPKSKDVKSKTGKGATATPTKELQLDEKDRIKTPCSPRTVPRDTLQPAIRQKYTEIIYGQVYDLLTEMIENMTIGFEDAKSTEL